MLSAIFFIIFLKFLKVSTKTEIVTAEIGTSAFLHCESTDPNTTFWAKRSEGRHFHSFNKLETLDPRFIIFRLYDLEIEKFQMGHAGDYSCVLKFGQSEERLNYKLEIDDSTNNATDEEYLPSYYYSTIKVNINANVNLPCEVIHYTDSYWIGWEKNGEVILQKTKNPDLNFKPSTMKTIEGMILEIQNVQPQDSDVEYLCLLGNGTKFTYNLQVFGIQDNIDFCSPSPCGLNSECHPKESYASCSCRKNYKGEPPNCIPDCKENCPPYLACLSERCVEVCETSCGINTECVIQEFKYKCVCQDNFFGNPFIECHNNSFLSKPNNKTIPVATHEVSLNSNVILECESDDFDLQNFVEWEKTPTNTSFWHKVNLQESRMQVYTQYNLLITNIKLEDEGEYVCKIIKENSAYNLTYKLEIIGISDDERQNLKPAKPYFSTIRAKISDSVILPCEGVNLNFQHLKWEAHAPKNPQIISKNLRLNFSTSKIKILKGKKLEIQNLQAEDAGTYSCFAISFSGKRQIISHVLKISRFSSNNRNPCEKSPCGINSDCYLNKNKPVCSCRKNHIGIPPFCIKNCIHDIDCFSIACVSQRCKVLCEESCGPDAECQIQNYIYTCICIGNSENTTGKCLPYSNENKCGGIPCSVISVCGPFAFLLIIVGMIIFLISKSRQGKEIEQSNQNVKNIGQENAAFNSLSPATDQTTLGNEKNEPLKPQMILNVVVLDG